MYSRPEAFVIVDGGYMAKTNEVLGRDIDLGKLFDKVCEPDFTRKRTYYFDALPWKPAQPTREQIQRYDAKQRFLDAIRFLDRTEVCLGRTQPIWLQNSSTPVFVQKLVDVLLSLKMVQLALKKDGRYFILIAGDSDFVPAVQAVKDAGGTVRVVYCRRKTANLNVTVHEELLLHADERFELTDKFCEELRR
ncbi:MAG: NYN domain-containing protein [Candidatus Thorarchaeota archaeon]|nr:NYN domain-containing protein [Candidatus Thorarchaeota archaeon]